MEIHPIVPALDMTSSEMNLRSGNLMHVHVTYDGNVITWTISDTVTHASFTSSKTIDIPTLVGGTTAFVGFTGSTGTYSSTQNILGWSHISGPAETFAATPVILPASGSYTSPQTVTIVDSTPGVSNLLHHGRFSPNDGISPLHRTFHDQCNRHSQRHCCGIWVPQQLISSASYTIGSGVSVVVTPANTSLTEGQSQHSSRTSTMRRTRRSCGALAQRG